MESLEQQLAKSLLWLERYDSLTQKEISVKLEIAQKEILALVAETKNKATLQREINRIMSEAFSTFSTVLINDDIEQISELAWNSTNTLMSAWVAKEVADSAIKWVDVQQSTKDKILNPNRLYQGYTINDHFKHLGTQSARKIRGIILNGYSNGLGIDEINRDIKTTIGNVNRNQSKTLVRTVLLESIEATKDELFETNFKGAYDSFKYSAVLDSRTSVYCRIAHNYVTTDKKTAKYQIKSHFNCRSMWIPQNDITRQYDKDNPNVNVVSWDKKTVQHRTGEKSSKFKVDTIKKVYRNASPNTVFDALTEQSKFDYLGKKRYELYKSGKITFKDAVDISRNSLIPVTELKKKLNL